MAKCNHCHQALLESYDVVVELVRNGEVTFTVARSGLHDQCARGWADAQTEDLQVEYGDDSDFSVISRVAVGH